MTRSGAAFTSEPDSAKAGQEMGREIVTALDGEAPDALIVFCSSKYDYPKLLTSLRDTCNPKVMVGCSSAGEFTNAMRGEGSASALALKSAEMQFVPALGRNLTADRAAAARQMASSFRGLRSPKFPYRAALVLTDALAGFIDDLVESLNLETGGTYRLFGGGAGDDANFSKTHVFFGTEAYTDAAVALEILSHRQLGVGVRHGWRPGSAALRVTEAEGARLVSLNAMPAVEAFEEYAAATGQLFDVANPLPFFLHNVIGVDAGGQFKLRVPLAVGEDGSITCAADIPAGSTVRIMSTDNMSAAEAASSAVRDAISQIGGGKTGPAIFFDCVATRLRMGKDFGLEMEALKGALGDASFVGCNTYGQIARVEGQFSGFHNCTATVCVFPE